MRIDPNAGDAAVTEEEIRMMVDEGSENGTIAESEKEIINNVFAFNDITADEVMTHRTDVDLLWTDEDDNAWAQTIYQARHSYYPVVGEDADDVKGVLSAKDYFRLSDRSRAGVLANAVKASQFVPESVKLDVLFRNMKRNRNHFAVVLDEYGGMSGIITINDLLEQLVGDLDDGSEPEEPELIRKISDNEWIIQGGAEIEDVAAALGVLFAEIDDYDTFGGWVFGLLGEVPDDGDTPVLERGEIVVEVTEVNEHRLESARVCKVGGNTNRE
jgi:putative hemolysin